MRLPLVAFVLASCLVLNPCHAQVAREALDQAQALLDEGSTAAALDILLASSSRATSDLERRQVAQKLDEVAERLRQSSLHESALRAREGALALRQALHGGVDHPDVANAWNNVGYCFDALGRGREALRPFEQALSMWKRLHGDVDHTEVATSLNNVAHALLSQGKAAEAMALHEQALAMRRRLHGAADHPHVATSLNNVAACLVSLGRAPEALTRYEEALAMQRRLAADGDDAEVAMALNNLAGCRHALGQLGEALLSFEQSLAMRRRLWGTVDHPLVATNLNNVAACLAALGRASEALPRYEEALAMQGRLFAGADHPQIATSLNNVASCLRTLGRLDEALPRYEQALAMAERISGGRAMPLVATNLNNVAGCLKALGRVTEALPRYEQSLAMRQRLAGGRDHPSVAQSLNNVASCLELSGRLAEALLQHEAALAMRQRLYADADHPDVAESLNNVAGCHRSAGRVEQALTVHEQALAMRRRLCRDADHPLVAQSLHNAALCLQLLGRNDEALRQHEQALAMQRRLYPDRDHLDVASGLNNLSGCLQALGRAEAAIQACEESVAIIERMREASRTSSRLRESVFDEWKRAGAFERLQQLALALGRFDQSLLAAERARGRELLDLLEQQRFDPVDEAERQAQRRGDEEGARRWQRLRTDLLQASLECDRTLQELTRLDQTKPADREARRAALVEESTAANTRLRQLLDEKSRSLGGETPGGRVRTAAEIAAILQPGEVFLEFTLTDPVAVLHVLASDGVVHAEALPAAFAATDRLLAAVTPATVDTAPQRGRDPETPATRSAGIDRALEVFTSLFPARVRERVLTSRRLIVSGHRALHRLPLESLVVRVEDGKPIYLLDAGPPICYVPSGSTLHWLRTTGRRASSHVPTLDLLAIGDPKLGSTQPTAPGADVAPVRSVPNDDLERLSQLPPLKGARAEAEAIVAAFHGRDGKAELLLGERATESAVTELAGRARYLHFACHGIAEEYAGQSLSMLVLTRPREIAPGDDGLLKLSDLLHAWRGHLPSCRLVVLSACRTNVGPTLRDEAPQALPLGFLFAGAPAVISSLWAVDDASTKELMVDFYSRLLAGETDQLLAFTAAKKALRARYPDPFHWAPFLYMGSPD